MLKKFRMKRRIAKARRKSIKLFGTDGIRGQVGEYPLDETSVIDLGRAIGLLIGENSCKVVFGRDTRGSGGIIEKQLAAGIRHESPNTEIVGCGVIPTPGLSFWTRAGGFGYGIMITASHNPYTDNGIKIFGGDGEKIPDEVERQLEFEFFQLEPAVVEPVDSPQPNKMAPLYYDFLKRHLVRFRESRLKVVLDCGHGATYQIAPRIFREARMEVMVIHDEPDGKNINLDSGSTYPRKLQETVAAYGADLGVAFDGDGDRVIFIDSNGYILDGDYCLFILAKYFNETRDDFNGIVVGTVMGNLGLEKGLAGIKVKYVRTDVGDRHVSRRLKELDAILGGEQSGHVILRCFQKTGDGILTALYFIQALTFLELHPAEVFPMLDIYPQELRNFDVKEKRDLESWDQLNQMIAQFNSDYGHNSRLLIRYSGTENKLRVMMESENPIIIGENIEKFERLIRSTIGK
ncbi:MAG: phosphoglucosamine mutase [bacterium]|nr:phosphoglucosamine mutase [bacterium]